MKKIDEHVKMYREAMNLGRSIVNSSSTEKATFLI